MIDLAVHKAAKSYPEKSVQMLHLQFLNISLWTCCNPHHLDSSWDKKFKIYCWNNFSQVATIKEKANIQTKDVQLRENVLPCPLDFSFSIKGARKMALKVLNQGMLQKFFYFWTTGFSGRFLHMLTANKITPGHDLKSCFLMCCLP